MEVIQLGPGLDVRGGVSAVERLIVEHVGATIPIQHIATMQEGTGFKKLQVFARAVRQLSGLLRNGRPMVVHIHFASKGSTLRKIVLARMALRAGRPVILHAHGGAFDRFYAALPGAAQRFVSETFRGADRLVVLSEHWRTFYVEHCHVPASKITVLHNPVRLPPAVPERRGRNTVQLLYLGRICQSKGAFDLLEAFAGLAPEERRQARLVLAGDGEVAELRRRAAPLGESVSVFDWVDSANRDALLIASDIFVLPSYLEGLPMALLEAMAYALPVIVTPVGGIPDVVSDSREGLLVRPGDIPQLRAALRALLKDEPRRLAMGARARERVAGFDVMHYTDHLLDVYKSLCLPATA